MKKIGINSIEYDRSVNEHRALLVFPSKWLFFCLNAQFMLANQLRLFEFR